jgi:DNA repair protein RadB
MAEKISTGCNSLDTVLQGGISRSGITVIYGEAGTGKTTLAIQIAARTVTEGLKVLYVDSDRSFTQQRFQQITGSDAQNLSELVLLFFPDNFEEQRTLIDSIENFVTPKVGLVAVDSVSSLYRAAFSGEGSIFTLNRSLGRQLAYLGELCVNRRIGCIVTSEVHTRLTPVAQVEPVARRALFHFPSTIIRINNTGSSNVKEILVERNEGVDMPNRSCILSLSGIGFADVPNV